MLLFLLSLTLLFLFRYSIFTIPAAAQCPVCIVTVGGGMLIARKLGVDDLLVAIWISALNTAISYWAAPKIKIKYLKNPLVFSALMYLTTLSYFWFTDQIGVAQNRIIGIDKIILGLTVGLIAIVSGNYIYLKLKERNGGKALFPYSKVAFPVGFVLVLTLVFKFIFNL